MSAPAPTLTVGGFARVAADGSTFRSGAGTGFSTLDQLSTGDKVAVLGGPIAAGGYQWYQIQFAFTEWPSADYPPHRPGRSGGRRTWSRPRRPT